MCWLIFIQYFEDGIYCLLVWFSAERSYEEDAQILRVIEAYCTSAKTRYTVNSGM
jgi:hypothetical protein